MDAPWPGRKLIRVMVLNDGSAQALSTDHKPNRPEGRARIRAAAGPTWRISVWLVCYK